MSSKRQVWIDLSRGFCMLAIIVHHVEMYYVGEAVIDYRLFVDNALCCFFFISGYLFYKETDFNIAYKLKSILRTIIIPYFFFMSAIAFPKALAHGNYTSILDTIFSILLGRESWFITALATAEIIFSFLLFYSKNKKWLLPIGVIISFISIVLLTGNEQIIAHNYWNIMDALLAVPFLYLGYLYHKKVNVINNINTVYYIIPLILFIASKYVIMEYEIYCYWGPVAIDNYFIFMADNIIAILLIVKICKSMPDIKPISWMGSHCIVYYFLCGGVPFVLSSIANRVGFTYQNAYYRVIIVIILTYLCITVMTSLIYKYIPWVTGKAKK